MIDKAVIALGNADIIGQVENVSVYFKSPHEMLRAPCGEFWKLVAKKKISKYSEVSWIWNIWRTVREKKNQNMQLKGRGRLTIFSRACELQHCDFWVTGKQFKGINFANESSTDCIHWHDPVTKCAPFNTILLFAL